MSVKCCSGKSPFTHSFHYFCPLKDHFSIFSFLIWLFSSASSFSVCPWKHSWKGKCLNQLDQTLSQLSPCVAQWVMVRMLNVDDMSIMRLLLLWYSVNKKMQFPQRKFCVMSCLLHVPQPPPLTCIYSRWEHVSHRRNPVVRYMCERSITGHVWRVQSSYEKTWVSVVSVVSDGG